MTVSLAGKRAIVTGSTLGMGFGIAKGLAEAGASVVLNGRNKRRLATAEKTLRREVPGAEVCGIAADLSGSSGVNHLIAKVAEADILVNNLGIFGPKGFFDITDGEWEEYFQINVMSGVRLSRHYAKRMAAKGWGRILFNGSLTGGFLQGEMAHYGATKTALLGLSRTLAETLAGTGVSVNVFIPGPTYTEKTEAFLGKSNRKGGRQERQLFERQLPTSLQKRFIRPSEIANFVVFLASDQACAITGAALRVDGGIVRYPI